MSENYKIIARYVKDMSSETPDIETFIFVRDNISKYQLKIDITSKALKDKVVEINTTFKFEDKDSSAKKSYFEMVYATVIKVNNDIKEKKDIEKIVLCDVQKEIYPTLETSFVNLLTNSGYPGIKFEKKVDFTELYKQRAN